MPKSTRVLSIAWTTALLCLAPGCTRKEPSCRPDVLVAPLVGAVRTLDPALAYDGASLDVIANIYERLYNFKYDSDTFEIEPQLAAAFPTISPDGRRLRIPLRKGVFYADDPAFADRRGREVLAKDFVLAFKRLADPRTESTGAWLFRDGVKGFADFAQNPGDFWNREIAGVRAIEAHTLEIDLTQPDPRFLAALTMSFTAPIPEEILRKYGNDKRQILEHPVGTGPYRLAEVSSGGDYTLVRNPTHRQPATIERIVFRWIREDQTRWLSLLEGSLDYAAITKDTVGNLFVGGNPDGSPRLKPEFAEKGFAIDLPPFVAMDYLELNSRDPVMKNRDLRRAISSAIDRGAWRDLFAPHLGAKQTAVSPTGLPDSPSAKTFTYDFDLPRARELLAKAGYPEGRGLPKLRFDLGGADTTARQFGDWVASQLGRIGISVEVVQNTLPAFLEKVSKGATQIAQATWTLDFPDPENAYQLLYGPNAPPGPNTANFASKEFDALYVRMKKLAPGPERAALLEKMEALVQSEVPWVYGIYSRNASLYRKHLAGFRFHPFVRDRYRHLRRCAGS